MVFWHRLLRLVVCVGLFKSRTYLQTLRLRLYFKFSQVFLLNVTVGNLPIKPLD